MTAPTQPMVQGGSIGSGRPVVWPTNNLAAAQALRDAGLFDQAWYLGQYPDVAASGIEPALHYVKFGAAMGRRPGPGVSSEDVQALLTASAAKIAPQTAAATASLKPDADTTYAVRAALEWAADKKGPEVGIQARWLAEAVLPPELAHTAAIVDVNMAVLAGDRAAWARALSEFLAGQGLPPIEVSDTPGNILDAVLLPDLPSVETGPKVSIIMPVYNAEATVAYSVRSILAQTWRPIELIVIDDASTDTTPSILADLAASDPRIILMRNAVNAGPYVSKNVGLVAATGDYVTGHDADDLALPQRIEQQVRFLQAGKHRCGFIGMLRMTAEGEVTRIGNSTSNSIDGVTSTAFISLMIERPLMRGIFGHWDTTRFAGDSELDKRITRILGGDVPRQHLVGQLMLDAPEGLTNHSLYGHGEGRISPSRLDYRRATEAWQADLSTATCYLPFPHEPRRFAAPAEMLNAPSVVEQVIAEHRHSHPALMNRLVECDVCIVTTLRFPGGNCSSTLDELRFLTAHGVSVRLVHCPTDEVLKGLNQSFETDERYQPWADLIIPWHDVGLLRCRHLIVRHPSVATSTILRRIIGQIDCEQAHYVINNGTHRETHERFYRPADVVKALETTRTHRRRIVPISPLIRRQLRREIPADLLAPDDWSPTFDVGDYAHPAKQALQAPFVIGRHGRDAPEKWIEKPAALRAAYPASSDIEVSILGGAVEARKLLTTLPPNWRVAEFGSVAPKDFLDDLDVFVFFPHSERNEAFGRTIVEAMIASRPVLLPPRFEEVFGDLAFYGQPHGVEGMVRALAADWTGARAWLTAVQSAAIARYSSEAIAGRMPDLGIVVAQGDPGPLPADLIAFKQRIEAAGAARKALWVR